MKYGQISDSHDWARREVEVGTRRFFHRQCRKCGRDFVMSADDGEDWRAVHVQLTSFVDLDDATNARWLSEECPGHRLPEDNNDRRTRVLSAGVSAHQKRHED